MPSIRDFSGGVLNQELQNRDNGDGILFDCKNVLSSWNGELRKRTGTRLLKELSGNSKIIPYRLSNGDDMIMLLREKNIKCYKFDDNNNIVPVVVSNAAPVPFPASGWVSNNQGNWAVNSNSSFSSSSYLALQETKYNSLPFSTDDFGTETLLYYQFNNTNNVVFLGCDIVWYQRNRNSYVYRVGLEPVIQFSDDGDTWTPVQTSHSIPAYSSSYEWVIGWALAETSCAYKVTNPSYTGAHKYWRIVFTQQDVRGAPFDASEFKKAYLELKNIKFSEEGTYSDLEFNNCPYEEDDFDNIRWSQNNTTLTMACKGKQPYQISVSGANIIGSVFVPTDIDLWQALGYPACVTYYQNRLWFGGFESFPTRVCASEFNKDADGAGFSKFAIPGEISATSPISVDGTEITGIIENMWGGNDALYCLSEDGVSMIDAQNAIVATNQIEFKLRNREPVNSMVPTVKDDVMIYLGRDRRKILVTDYDFVVQRFKAHCISDNYNNFLESGIKELHYVPSKSSLIYGSLENGRWFSILFDVDKGKNALYPLETTGQIKDIQPIKYGDETKLLLLAQMPSYQYVLEEKLAQPDQEIMDFMTTDEQKQYTKDVNINNVYLDHSVIKKYNSSVIEISNLPYMAGTELEVVADGQYLGEHKVLSREDTMTMYGWKSGSTSELYTQNLYTTARNPSVSDPVYDENDNLLSDYIISSVTKIGDVVTSIQVKYPLPEETAMLGYTNDENQNVFLTPQTSFLLFDEDGNDIGVARSYNDSQLNYNGIIYYRNTSIDKTIHLKTTDNFTKSTDKSIPSGTTYIALESPAKNVIIGYKYDSYAVLKFTSPYNLRKFPKEISVNFINSGYLEVGNTFDSLKSVLNNLVESVKIDNKKILMNGNYTKTLDKQTFETPYVIVRSDKGLPFIITGIDYKVDKSNYQGGV